MQRAQLKTNCFGDAYMPLVLKGVLLRHGLTQLDWGAAVAQMNGRPLSETGSSLLLNRGHWPKTTPAESIRRQTEDWLLAQGVPREALADIWEIDSEDRAAGKRAPVQAGQHAAPRAASLRLVTNEPAIMEVEMLSPAAKRHFKMFRDPFQNDIGGPEDVFQAGDQRYIGEAMYQTAKHGGFLAVVGESGSGKSTLRKQLIARLRAEGADGAGVRIIAPQAIDKSKLTVRHIDEAIILDLAPDARVRASAETRERQAKALLQGDTASRALLVIEEAHNLTIEALKHLKGYREIEQDVWQCPLGIVLIAQPELKLKLDANRYPQAREVIRRIEVAELAPLGQALEAYLAHKFRRVNVGMEAILAAAACEAIREQLKKKRTDTYPLLVNNLVTKAMNRAAELGVPLVTADVIKEV